MCRKGGDQEEKKNEDFFKDTNSRSEIPDGYKLHVNDGMSGYPEMENKCDLLYISVIQVASSNDLTFYCCHIPVNYIDYK